MEDVERGGGAGDDPQAWSALCAAGRALIDRPDGALPPVLTAFARALVPALADACVIAGGQPEPRFLAWACDDQAVSPALEAWVAARACPPPDAIERELQAALSTLAVMARPITSHGRSLGAIALVCTRRAPGALLPSLLDDAAARLTLAFEAAELRERERAITEQLRQAQKMDAVGRLAGGVAHDFNNLLTVISGYAEVMVKALPGDSPAVGHAMHIMRAAQRGMSLTRQLLAFGRQQVLDPVVVDVNEAVKRAASMLRHLIGEDVSCTLELAPRPARVRVDRGQLDQVLLNLVLNARDAMPRGGRLLLKTALSSGGAGQVHISVADSGEGMSQETRARMFEPYFTTKQHGTGLGLPTVLGIVEQSGGRVTVESEAGSGTTVHVILPEVLNEPASDSRREPSPTPRRANPNGPETILLVEDDDSVREFVELVLKSRGYTLLTASDGADALRLVESWAGPIDLLLSDVVMPSMSGCELAERLLALRPGVAVLHISGYPGESMARYGELTQGAQFLQKPFTAQQLAQRVRAILDGSSAAKAV